MASNVTPTTDDKLKAVAEEGNIEDLYKLILENAQVAQMFDMAETPLHIAASAGHLQFATEIMRLNPSFAWKLNQHGFSPIHLAMRHGQKRMVLRFVDINKDLVRVKGREGLTPLHFASQTGDIHLLAHFLSACPDSIEDVTVRGETALHIAVKNQQYEALQVLVGWLKRTRRRGAMQLEKEILNWKDEGGNTILHISALRKDSQTLFLLVETTMDLQVKNFENKTALDIAASVEIQNMLIKAKAKHGSSITDAPTLVDKLTSKFTNFDRIIFYILRIRGDISEDQRNAFLVVATLVATATFQSPLSPPGGVFQVNAGDNNANTTSLNSTATPTPGNAGKSIMSQSDFIFMSIYNTASLLISFLIIHIITPSGRVGVLLLTPVCFYVYCYLVSMRMISPTYGTELLNYFMLILVSIFYFVMSLKRFRAHAKNLEIETRNSAGGNRW